VPDEAHLLAALLFSFLAAIAATPIAIRIALKSNFQDWPERYKAHSAPTPYLGGAAVIFAFALSAVLFGQGTSRFASVIVGAFALWFVGTVDDRRTIRPALRVLAGGAAALLLWTSGLGWSLFGHYFADLALTSLWVIGLVNAFNLMDNMDGAAPTVAAVSGAGIATLALINDDAALGALALALVGASLGFLNYNLPSPAPAQIFLGDGGSMPIGFVLAAAIMSLPEMNASGASMLIPAALLVGLAIFDTTLVVVSRTRRHVLICLGARDHLTHRLLVMLRSTKAVAIALAVIQAVLCVLAIIAAQLGIAASVIIAAFCLTVSVLSILALELEIWPPRQTRWRIVVRPKVALSFENRRSRNRL
jgi:UDP-GlcNAc:undecaprenyl-phosphate GlcNAc-1-phosphate transferase